LTKWNQFCNLAEWDQARFLLDVATAATVQFGRPASVRDQVRNYIGLGYKLLAGDAEPLEDLLVFMQDPELRRSFSALYEELGDDKQAIAWMDIASYACAFICRLAAERSGYGAVPAPVVEAIPDIYEYYMEKAASLGITETDDGR
jgi:hypothetical protein